jgi:hypothetical protein
MLKRNYFKSFLAVLSVFTLLFCVNTSFAARYENLNVGNLTVEKSLAVQGLLQASANTTGDVYYVSSGSSGVDGRGRGKTSSRPFATLDYAVGRCTANNGDFIIVMPGHAESVIAAAGIDLDVAGITIIGLGDGSDRPAFTFTTATTADIDVDAANITIANCVFINDIDSLAAPIDVNAAYFSMIECDMRDDTAAKQTIRWILGVAAADNMSIINCLNRGSDTAGATAWITLVGQDAPAIIGCHSNGDFSAANVENITTACTDVLITKNHFENANAVDVNIEGFAAMTGWISFNSLRIATDGQVTWINTPGSASLFENYGVNNNGETGILAGTPSV